MNVKLGEKVSIDDITMTCFEKRESLTGWSYTFVYFNCGKLEELRFSPAELDALGARKGGASER